jgi:hypothetical protein
MLKGFVVPIYKQIKRIINNNIIIKYIMPNMSIYVCVCGRERERAPNEDQWRDLVNILMTIRVPEKAEHFIRWEIITLSR